MDTLEKYLKKLKDLVDVDWNDVENVKKRTNPILDQLAKDKVVLREFVENVGRDNRLMELSDRDSVLSKLTLFNYQGIRLRIHIVQSDALNRPHDHRWTLTNKILKGGYRHILFKKPDNFSTDLKYDDLFPFYSESEKVGDSYTLHHSIIHTLLPEHNTTITLIIRGPVMKEKILILDQNSGESWWHYGDDNYLSNKDEKSIKFTHKQYLDFVDILKKENIL